MVLPKPAVGLPLTVEVGAIPIVGDRRPTQAMRGSKSGSVRTGPSVSSCSTSAVSSTVGGAGVQAGPAAGAPAPPKPPSAPPLPLANGPTLSPVGVWNERPAKPRSTTSPTNMASASAVRRCAPAGSKRRRARGFSRRTTAEDPRASRSRFVRSSSRAGCGGGRCHPQRVGRRGSVGSGADSGGDAAAAGSSSAGTLPPAWAAIVLKRSLARASAFLRVPDNSQLGHRSNSSAWWAISNLVQARRRALTLGSAQSASVVESSQSRCTRRTAKARQTSSYRRRGRQ